MENSTSKVLDLLISKQKEIEDLEKDLTKNKIYQWKNEVLMILDKLITDETKYYKKFNELDFGYGYINDDPEIQELKRKKFCQVDLERAYHLIEAIIYGVKYNLL